MQMRRLIFGTALICAMIIGTHFAISQDPMDPNGEGEMSEEDAAAMERWMDSMTLNENHEWYAQLIGKWNVTSTMYGMGPEPSKSKGTAEFSWLIEGRWIQQTFSGEMMDTPFNGIGISGYDNFKKKFVNIWLDDMSTAMYMYEGTLDQTRTSMVAFGSMDEPMTGEHDKTTKSVTTIVDENTMRFEMHDLHIVPGSTKVFEMVYTRAE